MTQTPWLMTEPLVRYGPRTETSVFGDQIRTHSYDPTVPGAENLYCVGTTDHPQLLPHTTPPRPGVAHTYDYFQHSNLPSIHELNPPQPSHSPYSHFLVGSEPLEDTSTACGDPHFPQPSEIYSQWGSFHPAPDVLPSSICDGSPPTLYHPALDSTLYPDSSCRQSPWPTENIQLDPVDEFPAALIIYDPTTFPLPNPNPTSPNQDNTSKPHGGTLDASYPCQWMEGGVSCNVMVQATRSHMNRHLHAYHGFGGSDARQTRCHWAGCRATMQQGSIARHMVTCHLQAKVTCPMCSKKLSRQDVIFKHQRVCPAAGTWCQA